MQIFAFRVCILEMSPFWIAGAQNFISYDLIIYFEKDQSGLNLCSLIKQLISVEISLSQERKLLFFFFNSFNLKLTETGIWGGNEKGWKNGVELLVKSPFWEGRGAPGEDSGWWGELWSLHKHFMEAPCLKIRQIQQTKILYKLGTSAVLTIP